MDDIRAILDDAAGQIDDLVALHDATLTEESVRPAFRARIKSVLEQQRSALDYLAVGITNKHGTPKSGFIYSPLAPSSNDFPALMKNKMPGVAQAAPAVADAIKDNQPYTPTGAWLGELSQLTNEQKHNRLSLQLVRDTDLCRVTEDATGAFVEWHGIRFEPGR